MHAQGAAAMDNDGAASEILARASDSNTMSPAHQTTAGRTAGNGDRDKSEDAPPAVQSMDVCADNETLV